MGKVWKNKENMKTYFGNFRDKLGNNFGEILGKLFVSKFLKPLKIQ